MSLRGTSITLFSTTTVTVADVLIGLPSANGKEYTLGIPKGDTNEWADRKLAFFGRYWRTIGIPETGEQANIPLRWGSNVKVQLLETTGKCTVYDGKTYARHVFDDVQFADLRGVTVSTVGALPADTVTLNIWSCSSTDGYVPKAGDIIADGEQQLMFDTTSQKTVSESMAALRQSCRTAIVSTVSAQLNGLKPDITVTAR